MFVIRLLEFSFVLFLAALVITQIGIPLWRDTLLFPMFRKERKLEGEIAAENQNAVERNLRKKLNDLKVVEVPAAQDSGKPEQS